MTPQEARTEVQRAADELDALPADTPREMRREKRYAWMLAMQTYHFVTRMARYQQQQRENQR